MANAMTTQLHAMFPNRVGLLAEVTAALSAAGVNIRAICAYEFEGRGELMLVTDDNAKAKAAIAPMGGEVTEDPVIAAELPDRVGALEEVARTIGDAGIDIRLIYATTGGGAPTATIILSTADDARALGLLGG